MTTLVYPNGAIATPHVLASLAGSAVLADGGNAVDAIVAANLALGVVAPYYCGIGGDLLAVVWDGALHGYRSTGRSPAASSYESLRSRYDRMPYAGADTITVPGAVRGWFDLLDRFGTRSFAELSARAVELARDGFVLSRPGAFRLTGSLAICRALGVDDRALRDTYVDTRTGARVHQPALASLLELVGASGADAYYAGPVAEAICAAIARAGGVMTPDDLARHQSAWVEPLRATYGDFEVAELPPPTQGASALEMLRIAQTCGLDVAADERLHRMVEAAKSGLADRDRFIGDPAHLALPAEDLFSDARVSDRAAAIGPSATPWSPVRGADGDTAYLCAVDRSGLAVSLIQSNFTAIGSGVHVPEYGINLHNRGAAFTLDPGLANTFGPDKMPMHTLIPSMVLRDGRPAYVFGTMGGHAQAQIHLQVLTSLLIDGDEPHAAIDAPRWAFDPDSAAVRFESRFDPELLDALRARGHRVETMRAYDDGVGHAHCIQILDDGYAVAADPRAESAALGH